MSSLGRDKGEGGFLNADDLARLDRLGLPPVKVIDPIHILGPKTTGPEAVRDFGRVDKAMKTLEEMEEH